MSKLIKLLWCKIFHTRMWTIKYEKHSKEDWFCFECGREFKRNPSDKSKN